MFENIIKFFKNLGKKEKNKESSDTAKERLHLVLMQDRANVSADFLELMKQEIIEVIKKYIDIDEKAIDVRLTNKTNDDGTVGAPALYANIPIVTIKNEARIANVPHEKKEEGKQINKIEKEESKKDKAEKNNENKEKNETEQENKLKQSVKTGSDDTSVKNDIIGTKQMDKEVEKNDTDEQSKQTEKVIEEAKKIQSEIEKENKIKSDETQEKVKEENPIEENKVEEKIEKEGIEDKKEEQNVS